jgi:hypothetical protein
MGSVCIYSSMCGKSREMASEILNTHLILLYYESLWRSILYRVWFKFLNFNFASKREF